MKNPLLVPELREYIAAGDTDSLRDFCACAHPGVVGEFLSALEASEVWNVLSHADPPVRAEVFSHLEHELQIALAESMPRVALARIIMDMPHDDRVDVIKRLPEDTRDSLLPVVAQTEREDIRRLSEHPEGSAGSVMTSEYATLGEDLTARDAIDKLRLEAPNKETIYYAYVLDDARRLTGLLSLKDLILARPWQRVGDIAQREIIYARVNEDQEEAARKIQKYDLLALPVVDANGALVGIITHDDAIDIITQEQTEDIEKLMAIGGSHEAGVYLKTPSFTHFRNRAYWVVGLAALGIVSGMIVNSYQATLEQFMILVLYMPMLAAAGGNTGSQASTVVVRALAVGEIVPRDAWRVIVKEFKVAVMLAFCLGLLSWGKVAWLSSGTSIPAGQTLAWVGMVIAIALGIQVVTATIVGACLPLAASKLKIDPALVASPVLATIVDMTGLIIYFQTARILLGI
jgi:magnesium transporter